jgi:hypothetical protein
MHKDVRTALGENKMVTPKREESYNEIYKGFPLIQQTSTPSRTHPSSIHPIVESNNVYLIYFNIYDTCFHQKPGG